MTKMSFEEKVMKANRELPVTHGKADPDHIEKLRTRARSNMLPRTSEANDYMVENISKKRAGC